MRPRPRPRARLQRARRLIGSHHGRQAVHRCDVLSSGTLRSARSRSCIILTCPLRPHHDADPERFGLGALDVGEAIFDGEFATISSISDRPRTCGPVPDQQGRDASGLHRTNIIAAPGLESATKGWLCLVGRRAESFPSATTQPGESMAGPPCCELLRSRREYFAADAAGDGRSGLRWASGRSGTSKRAGFADLVGIRCACSPMRSGSLMRLERDSFHLPATPPCRRRDMRRCAAGQAAAG